MARGIGGFLSGFETRFPYPRVDGESVPFYRLAGEGSLGGSCVSKIRMFMTLSPTKIPFKFCRTLYNAPIAFISQRLFIFLFFGWIFCIFSYYIQHCFICRPSDSTVPTDAGIEPMGPLQLMHWQSDALTTRLDRIRKARSHLISSHRLGGNGYLKRAFE